LLSFDRNLVSIEPLQFPEEALRIDRFAFATHSIYEQGWHLFQIAREAPASASSATARERETCGERSRIH